MLTGDKVETAQCIAISTQIFKNKEHSWAFFLNLQDTAQAERALKELQHNSVLIIDGDTLSLLLGSLEKEFVKSCAALDAVIFCRTSPTQKSQIVRAVQQHSALRVCAIGDGGNDVGMINSAHLGVGIEGKEGLQASLAADFSICEFRHLVPLVLWHGRLSYLRTSKLAHFVFHRGMTISVIQFLFLLLFYYAAIPIYNGYLILGYTTVFTSLPVFALVLDRDSDFRTIQRNAILYQKLQLGRALNFLRFLLWAWKSVYQGSVIILLAVLLFPEHNTVNIVAITFSSLVLTELLNVATIIQTWHRWIVAAELGTFTVYCACILLLKGYFDLEFIVTPEFLGRVSVITAVSWLPVHLLSKLKECCFPDEGRKLRSAN